MPLTIDVMKAHWFVRRGACYRPVTFIGWFILGVAVVYAIILL